MFHSLNHSGESVAGSDNPKTISLLQKNISYRVDRIQEKFDYVTTDIEFFTVQQLHGNAG